MISLDASILAALVIFLSTVVALNYILFRPLIRIQTEREARTTGLVVQSRKRLDDQAERFRRFEATIRQARMEAYQRQERARAEAMSLRTGLLGNARRDAESLVGTARAVLRRDVATARDQLAAESAEIARIISSAVLQRSN